MGRGLHTNLALIDADDTDVEVGVFEGYDRERHRALEQQHSGTHLFRRHRNTLEVVGFEQGAARLGESTYRRSARRLGRLLGPLVEESVGRFLDDSSSRLAFLRRRPLKVASLEPKNDVAHELFGGKTGLPVRVRRGYKLEARSVVFRGRRRTVLAIDAHLYAAIDATLADLVADGVDLVGLYAQIETPGRHELVGSERRTAGVISRVDGGVAYLGTDRRQQEVDSLTLAEGFLDPSPAALKRLLDHYVGGQAHDQLWGARSEMASGTARLSRLDALRSRLGRESLVAAQGAHFTIGDWVTAADLSVRDVAKPRFVVGSGGGRTTNATTGVFGHGPRLAPPGIGDPIRAAVVCEASRQKDVREFLAELADGLGRHRGLTETWKLPSVRWDMFPAADASSGAYEQACRAALDANTEFDLAVVQSPEGTEELRGSANPYLVSKAKFLSRSVPVQEFQPRTIRKPESQRQWALGGIALQVFAKLGGVPWLLKAPEAPPWEVVLGLGSAELGSGRFGGRERIVGLATAFSGDGTYWMTEASKAVPYGDHEAALGDTAAAAIRRIRSEMAWQSGDPVRLVVHSFQNFRGAHTKAVLRELNDLEASGHPIEVAFVHIVDFHPFLLFDRDEQNRVPPRGKVTQLSDFEALVTLLGPDELRFSDRGFTSPVLIRLDRNSTFKNLDEIARQVLAFAAHSWRDFKPTSAPVTVLYPALIAKLLGKLGDMPKWDPDVVRGEVGRTRWFL